jgi:hypothetical protein
MIKRAMLIGLPEKVEQALQYTGRLFIIASYTTLGILGCANATACHGSHGHEAYITA